MVLGYARTIGKKLNIRDWPHCPGGPAHLPYREIDTRLENVRRFIVFPDDVRFGDNCGERFQVYLGGGVGLGDFHRAFAPGCSREALEVNMAAAARDISFCSEILSFLADLPARLIGIQIRRSDKVRTDFVDGGIIHPRELGRINSLTFAAIDRFVSEGRACFVCGDEDDKARPFRDHVVAGGGRLVAIPAMPKWQATYWDLAVLSRSEIVVVSHTGSNFGRCASLIGGGLYAPVHTLF